SAHDAGGGDREYSVLSCIHVSSRPASGLAGHDRLGHPRVLPPSGLFGPFRAARTLELGRGVFPTGIRTICFEAPMAAYGTCFGKTSRSTGGSCPAAEAAAAEAAGTISKSILASRKAASSSCVSPKLDGSLPFRRTTLWPLRA